jgi:hypothetical protein
MTEEAKNISPEKMENGLSHDEHKWLSDWLTVIQRNQEQEIKFLHSMNTTIQIMAALILISVIVAACSALFHVP